jgi:integrase
METFLVWCDWRLYECPTTDKGPDLQRGFITLSERDTKNGESRLVPLTTNVRHALAELFKVRSLLTNKVFLYYNGRSVGSVKKAFNTAVKDSGIQNFRFHDLRHWAVTNLRKAGVDTVTAMKIVGHKSEKMYKRYNHVNERILSRLPLNLTP